MKTLTNKARIAESEFKSSRNYLPKNERMGAIEFVAWLKKSEFEQKEWEENHANA